MFWGTTCGVSDSVCVCVQVASMPCLQPQQPAPYFKTQAVVNGEFKEVSLDDYKGKYVVLFFYPLDFTFVCPTEIIAFSEAAKKFRDINCEVSGARRTGVGCVSSGMSVVTPYLPAWVQECVSRVQ